MDSPSKGGAAWTLPPKAEPHGGEYGNLCEVPWEFPEETPVRAWPGGPNRRGGWKESPFPALGDESQSLLPPLGCASGRDLPPIRLRLWEDSRKRRESPAGTPHQSLDCGFPCPRSSGDRAPASGAGCAGSNPAGGTQVSPREGQTWRVHHFR